MVKEALKTAWEKCKTSPNTAPCETNVQAKSWKIKAPDGQIYEINNLALWARENEDILPSDAKHFSAGIINIKRSIQGKKKHGCFQYKGWTLLEYYEENKAREGFPEPVKREPRKKMSDEERLAKKRQRAREYYKRKKKED